MQEQRFSAGGAGVAIDRHKKPGSGAGWDYLTNRNVLLLFIRYSF